MLEKGEITQREGLRPFLSKTFLGENKGEWERMGENG